MRERHKVLLSMIGGCIALTIIFTINMKTKPLVNQQDGSKSQSMESKIIEKQSAETIITGNQQTLKQMYEQDVSNNNAPTKNKYEENLPDLEMDVSYLGDFIGRGKQFILKRQIQMLAGNATSVKCFEYQKSIPEDMRMELYFLLDTGEVLRGFYNYYTRETSVEQTDLTESDVLTMIEKEKKAYEQKEQEARAKEKKDTKKEVKQGKQKKVQENGS